MTRQATFSNTHSREKGMASRGLSLVGGLCLLLLASGASAQSTNPEVGAGPESYRPAKTTADYNNGAATADPARPDADFDFAGNTLRVEVWTDKAQDDIYRKGEEISVGFETNRDAYAVVYRIDADGYVTVLWPRSRFDDGFVFGGHDYQLPVTGASRLRVANDEGQGLVEAVVSQYPFDLRSLEIDFHHEHKTERYDFRVAGDPFLAMNEVNFAVTGLEDSGEYVVTNYADYYVHQTVDHPRYLCSQCHNENEVAYDPYQDECTLTIEYDYSWYNGWYDRYGYYPVYGNPVYVYVDPWTWSPWVNYWYRPYYTAAPWNGWGWGWGACYSWNYSPYYWGDCVTVYNSGYQRYRPLDRARLQNDGIATKTREFGRGSAMVRSRAVSDQKRDAMASRTRTEASRGSSVVAGRSGGAQNYRGEAPKVRSRQSYEQVARNSGRGGLRIRENVRTGTGSRLTGSELRHTSAGEGRRPGLVPVSRDDNAWRGTTRVGGRSGNSPATVGNSRGSTRATGGSSATVQDSRSRTGRDSKTVQPRTRSTRVWNSSGSRDESTRSRSSSGSRDRGTTVDRSRSNSGSSGDSRSVKPRSGRSSDSSRKSSGSVRDNSGSRSRSSSSSSGSRSSGSRSSGSRSGGSSKSRSSSDSSGRR